MTEAAPPRKRARSEMPLQKRQQITIKEVAAKAGVSQMTVSRVINRAGMVRDETRERVEAAISELNYRPNLMARGLAAGKTLTIGLVYNNPSSGYLSELLVGALNSCRTRGHHLQIEDLFTDNGIVNPADVAARIRNAGVDGVLLAPPLGESEEVVEAIRALGIAVVRISPGNDGADHISVRIDDMAAADAMTQYLIDKGHREIGFITGAPDQQASAERAAGFHTAMARNKLSVREEFVQQGSYNYRSGMQAADALLSLPKRPTAIFAANDDMAAGTIAAAYSLGLRVPEDVSVVGFDDTPIADSIWPRLTTVRQPIAEMARTAVTLLDEALLSPDGEPEKTLVLDVSIIERESVATLD